MVGLDLGADDYVTKPFGVRNCWREFGPCCAARRKRRRAEKRPGRMSLFFKSGQATIDRRRFKFKRGKAPDGIDGEGAWLLQLFSTRIPGEVLYHDRLLNRFRGYGLMEWTCTLDLVVVKLRKKLGDNGGEPKHLITGAWRGIQAGDLNTETEHDKGGN